MERIHYLYRITNQINQKVYIGQTVVPSARWRDHRNASANPKVPLQFAISKYGAHNFEFEVIACCLGQDNANLLETELVSQYDSHVSTDKGYNATYGGMNTPKTEEWKEKISKMLMGHEVSEEARQKISQSNAGKVRTDEFKKNVGDYWRDRERTEENKMNVSVGLQDNQNCLGKQNSFGYRHSEEAKKKIGEASRNQPKRYAGKTWKLVDGKRVWLNKIE